MGKTNTTNLTKWEQGLIKFLPKNGAAKVLKESKSETYIALEKRNFVLYARRNKLSSWVEAVKSVIRIEVKPNIETLNKGGTVTVHKNKFRKLSA